MLDKIKQLTPYGNTQTKRHKNICMLWLIMGTHQTIQEGSWSS